MARPTKTLGKRNDPKERQYRVGTLDKALTVLESLESSSEPLRIRDVVEKTSIERAAVFRLLCTLETRGYIERLPDKRYRVVRRRRRICLGYLAPLSGNPFRRDVTAGMQKAAATAGVELLMLNSDADRLEDDLANIQVLLDAHVDLVILFQPRDSFAHVLADRLIAAGLPLISVENPIPGAFFFGGNSYRAGLMAGRALGRFARENWRSRFDKLVLLESSLTAPANRARLSGTVEGLRELLGGVPESHVLHLDGQAHQETSQAAIGKLLDSLPPKRRLLISAFNDLSAVGALNAIREAGGEKWTAIAGQNGPAESRTELARPGSALIASVAYFPEKYGEKLIQLTASILNGERPPLAVYTDHVLLDARNVSQYY
jgi:ribose transport system substrate-binding protein